MNLPGIKSLGDITVGAAATQYTEWVTGLDGMLSLAAQIRFVVGTAGSTVKVYLQTSLDQGTTAIDIGCFAFTTAAGIKVRNLSALTPKTTDVTPTDGTLADDTSVDGILGDRVRLKVVSTGTYGGSTTVTGRANVR